MAVEPVVEAEEAAEIAPLRLDGRARLPGDLALEVQLDQGREAARGVGESDGNVMVRA